MYSKITQYYEKIFKVKKMALYKTYDWTSLVAQW